MPATVALSRFEDLIARGLTALIDDDPNLEVVAEDLDPDGLQAVLAERRPDVALLNYGSLRTPFEVHELHSAHPGTRLVVLASRPTAAEANQMLTFGATACLSKETQARDVLNAIHLASRGLQVLPAQAGRRGPRVERPRAAHRAGVRRPRPAAGRAVGRRDRARAAGRRRDGPHPRAQHLPQARRAHPPRARGPLSRVRAALGGPATAGVQR